MFLLLIIKWLKMDKKLKTKSLYELTLIKTALHTLIGSDLHQDVLIKTEELVAQEIERKTQEDLWCECGCEN